MKNDTEQIIDHKLHAPLKAVSPDMAAKFMQGGYNQPGYGVPKGASIDGSFATGDEGDQGYYVNGGKEIFLSTVKGMKDFFRARSVRLNRPLKYVIKPGIGGQHTPFQGIADAFQSIDPEAGRISGEYELGKDYESYISAVLKELKIGWDQIALIPSSKSGSTDETMMIFTEIFYLLLKNIAAKEGFDGRLFADTVLKTMHEVNFLAGKEKPAKDLFKGFSLELIQKNLHTAGLKATYEEVKKIFGIVLGNMFFETTDRPEQSRLSAFIRNSGLDKELGKDAPGFGAMFDNVGGRWTADLHMMTFLAYYNLDAEEYWSVRYEGIKKVRSLAHRANKLARKVLSEGITDIALIVPDRLFWFGKAMEQNFNESIWQEGFANLIAVKESEWDRQKPYYAGNPSRFTIDISKEFDPKALTKQMAANTLGELFTTFYGFTHTVGNALIARAVVKNGFTLDEIDPDDLGKPATRVFQQNLYLRQPYVELGKGLLEKRLKELQQSGSRSIEKELDRIKAAAKKAELTSNLNELDLPPGIDSANTLKAVVDKAVGFAREDGRKLVPFIYLEGEKFTLLRECLVKKGVEWVMQGTGDQHISYQQVLAQPQKYLPFIVSFVPDRVMPGRPAIGFAKGYLDNVSPNMVRDLFAEASYRALTEPRKDEAGGAVTGAAGIFLRITDSEKNCTALAGSFTVH